MGMCAAAWDIRAVSSSVQPVVPITTGIQRIFAKASEAFIQYLRDAEKMA